MDRIIPTSARVFAPILLALALFGDARATPLDVSLTFGSLPSAQGFTYDAVGSHAGTPEGTVFSIVSGVLAQNTIGLSNGVSGGSILYSRTGGITTTESKRIQVRARCLATQASALATSGQGGFIFGFNTGSVQYAFGLTATRLSVLQPSGTVLTSGTYDNTQFHDYDFVWAPGGSFQLYRDGTLVHSGSGGFAFSSNRLFLGDGTGGANAQGEISHFRFSQDLATHAESRTWGRIKRLYH